MRKGPLLVYKEDEGITMAFRNIPGIELATLDSLNGSYDAPSTLYKQSRAKAYQLPRPFMTNADITRIINSDEVQSVLNDPKTGQVRVGRKRNPLKNMDEMIKLNPYASVVKRAEILAHQKKGYPTKKRALPKGGKVEIRATKKAFLASMLDETVAKIEDSDEEDEEEDEEEGGDDEAAVEEVAKEEEFGDDY